MPDSDPRQPDIRIDRIGQPGLPQRMAPEQAQGHHAANGLDQSRLFLAFGDDARFLRLALEGETDRPHQRVEAESHEGDERQHRAVVEHHRQRQQRHHPVDQRLCPSSEHLAHLGA